MYLSLRRFLADRIDVSYDAELNITGVFGCQHDLSLIRAFCAHIGEDDPEELTQAIVVQAESEGYDIVCDHEWLTKYSGDFLITEIGELPLNPN